MNAMLLKQSSVKSGSVLARAVAGARLSARLPAWLPARLSGLLLVVPCIVAMLGGCETVSGVVKDVKKIGGGDRAAVGETYRPFTSEPDIRIRVDRDATTTELSGPSQLVARPVGGGGGGASATALLNTPVKVLSGPTGVETVDAGGRKRTWGAGVDLEFLASQSPTFSAESIKVGASTYPGFVTVKPRWNDAPARFDVIVSMPIETYLPGVLMHELFKDWPRQTFEAQAVAARTYALHERARARREGKGWDVEDSTDDQVYGGTTPSIVSTEAARATRGRVLTSDGYLLRAYYSSCCGGRPASAEEAWPANESNGFNRLEPVQGKTRPYFCQASPLYRWQVTRPVDDVSRRLRAWGRSNNNDVQRVARVREIVAKDRNDAGRVNVFRVSDSSGGSYSLAAESLRQALNTPSGELPGITRETRIHSADFDAEFFADRVRFSGRGFGHGVGMCQWCACGMAKAGWDWNTMIKTFYPGVEVQKAY